MDAPSDERPTGNTVTVPIPIVSAPIVNNIADEAECTIVLDINYEAEADLAVTASYLSE